MDLEQTYGNVADDAPAVFPSLDRETRPAVDTATAAHWLGRRPQTLQKWASLGTGPIVPMRVYGRLAWPVARIRALLSGSAK